MAAVKETFGCRVQRLIQEKGLDLTVVSTQAGIALGYLRKITQDGFRPPLQVRQNIARALGVEFTEMVKGTEVEE